MSDATDETDFASLQPTTEKSKAIKAIGKDTVHKICSGQVVLSLAVAVKELVENSIDANASLVEVKLKDQGLETLEVSDNGCGVEEHNLEGMTAKYHTSKIREFTDLMGVETFGFRGEALSSLCALADMSIVTRHRSSAVAVRLELDHKGQIKKRTPCAGPVGTTVTLANLFSTLPVRKREFQRNIKKEFNKMCQVMQAYGLVSKGVRIICTNTSAKGGKSVLMRTHGVQEIVNNIEAIFGARQRADLIELKTPSLNNIKCTQESLVPECKAEDNETAQLSPEELDIAEQFKLEGYVSSCTHGSGRSSRDRQYFYINSRPCDPKNLIKLVNEVYHRYNSHQYPFIYLNILLKRSDVDVNLTPDKRQLLINNEKLLLLFIKKSLIDAFGNLPATFKMQNISNMMKVETQSNSKAVTNEGEEKEIPYDEDNAVPRTSARRFQDVLSQWKNTGDTRGVAPNIKTTKRKCSDEVEVRTLKLKKIQEYLSREEGFSKTKVCSYGSESDSDSDPKKEGDATLQTSVLDVQKMEAESKEFDVLMGSEKNTSAAGGYSIVERIDCKVITTSQLNCKQLKTEPISDSLPLTPLSQSTEHSNSVYEGVDNVIDEEEEEGEQEDTTAAAVGLSSDLTIGKTILLDDSSSDEVPFMSNATYEIHTTIAEIELSLHAEENHIKQKLDQAKLERLRFKSEINPTQNSTAEQELQREISKDMFAKMDVIGQFNLGFIVVKLDTDLFIVDQHATDEKYNFEMLQRSVVLHHQPLAVPQALDMTAVNEMILLDHLEVFEKNGFKFAINENAPPTKKLYLLGKPVSKNWEFGKADIDELVFMLQDAPEGTMCRPSRIRDMFASRACRKSVMIGKALNRATMKMLLTHMGEIEQPWNCPHGRPTMRHLINIAMLHEVVENLAK